jgi:hypothetical protein
VLPVAPWLEKPRFRQRIEEHVTISRLTKAMPAVRFALARILARHVGFSRLNHLPSLQREAMLTD